jgi:hypothetical protein
MRMGEKSVSRRAVLTAPFALLVARVAWASPVPQPLFVIERSKNANQLHYDAMVTSDGGLDTGEPVVAYWIMKAQDGHREALTDEERRYAYGFSVSRTADGAYGMKLVAYKDRPIALHKDGARWRAEILVAGRLAALNRIFIQTKESVIPSVRWIDLYGMDVITGQPISERVSK